MKGKMIIITLVSVLCWSSIIVHFGNTLRNQENTAKSKVGNQIIIGKDTSIITDYSLLLDNYTLSNGTQISTELANKMSTK